MDILNIQHNSPMWHEFRQSGIGGSDAAAIMGLSPYKSNVDLWLEKTGKKQPKQTNNAYVDYGKKAEEHITALFALDFPKYEVKAIKDVVYRQDFLFASLDAELTEKATNQKGGLEVKTTEIQKRADWDKWFNKIPDNYYIQVLHYFLVTGWDFWVTFVKIKSFDKGSEPTSTLRPYFFDRTEVQSDLELLLKKETEFWKNVKEKRRPNLILPPLERKIIV